MVKANQSKKNDKNILKKNLNPKKKAGTTSSLVKSRNILNYWKHILGYGIVTIIIAVMGYFYYISFVQKSQLKQEVRLITNSLNELENQRIASIENLEIKVTGLHRQLKEMQRRIEVFNNKLEIFGLSLDELQPREVWQQQIAQLLYLAEQERILGNSPVAINYLLSEARELTQRNPIGENIALLAALDYDIQNYESLFDIESTNIFQEVGYLRETINELEINRRKFVFEKDNFSNKTEKESKSDILADYKNLPWVNRYWKYISYYVGYYTQQIFNGLSPYIRITNNKLDSTNLLSEEQIPLLLLSMDIMVLQAQSAILSGEEELYKNLMQDISKRIVELFAQDKQRDLLVKQINDLAGEDIIPKSLPPLRSVESLYAP